MCNTFWHTRIISVKMLLSEKSAKLSRPEQSSQQSPQRLSRWAHDYSQLSSKSAIIYAVEIMRWFNLCVNGGLISMIIRLRQVWLSGRILFMTRSVECKECGCSQACPSDFMSRQRCTSIAIQGNLLWSMVNKYKTVFARRVHMASARLKFLALLGA